MAVEFFKNVLKALTHYSSLIQPYQLTSQNGIWVKFVP
jgi:hypothetical protein